MRTRAWQTLALVPMTLPVLLVAVAAHPLTAQAAPLELKLYAEYGLTSDSNIYRTFDPIINQIFLGTRRQGDLMQQTTVGAEANWAVSRQRFSLAGWVSRRRFQHFRTLNHTASLLNGTWRFEVGRRVTGTLSFNSERRMQSFSDSGLFQPDNLTTSRPRMDAYYAITPKWHLHGQLEMATVDHSLAAQRRYDRRTERGLLGLEYRKGSLLDVEGGVEYAHGRYPARLPGDPLVRSYSEVSPFVRARWMFSGVSTLDGRLGYTRRSGRGGIGDRDFGGLTGRIGYQRQLTGATRMNVNLSRGISSSDGVVSNYVRDTGLSVDLGWTPDPKVGVALRAGRRWLGYQGVGGISRDDVVDVVEARLTYAPWNFMTFSFNLGTERRGSNVFGAGYDTVYGGVLMRVSWDNVRGLFDR